MMLITTSHRPTRRTRSFGHDLEKVFPNSLYLTRGKKTIQDLLMEAYDRNYERLLIINVWKGNPLKMTFIKVDPDDWGYLGYLYLHGIKLQREIGFRNLRPIREEMPFVVTTAKRVGIDHTAFAQAFAELTGGKFVPRGNKSLQTIADKNNTDVIGVIENYPRGMAVNFYRFDVTKDRPVGPLILVKIWIMEDGRRWDYKEALGLKRSGQSRE
ncbi:MULTISPECIES: ribosomal biogenesis protein [Thermococcus]|uniref:Probable Brix domain-containing ribosomal biogenesis protein n=1 Tax=Thermococcus nautili TaxID=195522 RepID=W8PIC6_9EURY|nr:MULTISPECIES: ribosomal biogenesis protein [Thermococcus]AHL21874.1 putative exosome subunit/U3 small nucleolar ribonucleoprotein (snoRNP) component, contains IMP4 domain [Thermococcus nautili]NJE48886.1 ribosomal biogenesis protein [Thermococcus sp. 9N3]CAI1494088.1 putative Brix domain-containing ribosomal biogenesis protein [Thermococcus nautili]